MNAIGVDMGGTSIKIASVDPSAQTQNFRQIKNPTAYSKEKLLDQLVNEIKEILQKEKIESMGLGVPGCVDFEKGVIHTLINMPGWDNTPIASVLEKRLGIKVCVDNDVNVMALGELYYGAAKGARNVIAMTLGTGVGGALILNGQIYRGSSFAAGEIGHVIVEKDGPRCNCGSFGCLEVFLGNQRLMEQARDAKSQFPDSILNFKDDLTPIDLERAALEGDSLANHIWNKAGVYLGIVVSGLVNVYNPDRVVIGGGVAGAGKLIFDPLRRMVNERSMMPARESVEIVKAELDNHAGVIGAATLAMNSHGAN